MSNIGSSAVEIHLRCHLGKLPDFGPFNPAGTIFAASHLVENQLPKCFSLALEHEFARVWLGSFKEAESWIRHNADALKRHQRSHHVSEIGRQTKRIFINYFRQIVS